jgi:hypothetical protein
VTHDRPVPAAHRVPNESAPDDAVDEGSGRSLLYHRWVNRGLGLAGFVAVVVAGTGALACRAIVGFGDSSPEDLTTRACGLGYGACACASCASARGEQHRLHGPDAVRVSARRVTFPRSGWRSRTTAGRGSSEPRHGVGYIKTSVNVLAATLTVMTLDGMPVAMGVAVNVSTPGGTLSRKAIASISDLVRVASRPSP